MAEGQRISVLFLEKSILKFKVVRALGIYKVHLEKSSASHSLAWNLIFDTGQQLVGAILSLLKFWLRDTDSCLNSIRRKAMIQLKLMGHFLVW